MPPTALLLVYALGAVRVVGLITADEITSKLRARAIVWLMPEGRAGYATWRWVAAKLLTCAWCASIYVGITAAVVWYTVGDWPPLLVLAAGLAISQLAGMLSDVGR